MSLSVGVECDIGELIGNIPLLVLTIRSTSDILFIHIHVSVHIGADMTLWGPRPGFGGLAHVDFWFFGTHMPFMLFLFVSISFC